MELISIAQARLVALIQVQQWDPFGKALTLEALGRLASRYSFVGVPTRLEEIDFNKGVELKEGAFGEIRVDRIIVFMNAIVIDTRSSTDDSEKVLGDILVLANEAFGAAIKSTRQTFSSQVMFRSEMRLSSLNPVLPKVADVLTHRTSTDLKHSFAFEPTAVVFNVDTAQSKTPPPLFSIERRVDVPFVENIYFSQAPLRTAEHLELLRDFEAAIL